MNDILYVNPPGNGRSLWPVGPPGISKGVVVSRRILAVNRMSSDDLWKHLTAALTVLERSGMGELTYRERKALTTRARECAVELRLRGDQLRLTI